MNQKQIIPYLFAVDFDGTLFQTFEPCPNGLGVEEASRKAIETIFGSEGVAIYDSQGGLKNRSPSELVMDVMKSGDFDSLKTHADHFFIHYRHELDSQVPPGKGIQLEISWDLYGIITEMFVRLKLSYLLKQVGTPMRDGSVWPNTCAGLKDFLEAVKSFNTAVSGVHIDIAILSSGHDYFIEKCFKVWEIDPPHLIISDDSLRGLSIRAEFKSKPSTFGFELLHSRWCEREKMNIPLDHCLYGGDCPNKDGGLARNLGSQFLWVNPLHNGAVNIGEDVWSIESWTEVAEFLRHELIREQLRLSRPIREIIALWKAFKNHGRA